MTWKEYLAFVLILSLFAFVGATTGGWVVSLELKEDFKPDTVFYYEASPDWIGVNAIYIENDILKKQLDDLQAHYDSMMCTRYPVR